MWRRLAKASVGQTAPHRPHFRQSSATETDLLWMVIECVGHTSRQREQTSVRWLATRRQRPELAKGFSL